MNEMKNLYHDENEFRSKILNHEFEMPPMAWDDMAARLDDVGKVKPKAAASWWKSLYIGLGLSVAAGAVGLGIYQYDTSDANTIDSVDVSQQLHEHSAQSSQPIAKLQNAEQNAFRQVAPTDNIDDFSNELTSDVAQEKKATTNYSSTKNQTANTSKSTHSSSATAQKLPTTTQNNTAENLANVEETTNNTANNQTQGVKTNKTKVTYHYSISKLKALHPSLSIGDGNATGNAGFEIGRVGTKWASNWEANIIGGATAKMQPNNPRTTVSPMVGAIVAYNANAQHAIEVGAQYKNLTIPTSSDVRTTYADDVNLGSQAVPNQSATPIRSLRNLHTVEMPIGYRATLHPKHSIRVGGKVAYLLGAETHKLDGIDNPSMHDMKLNRVNAGVYCGYEWNMTEHLGLGLQYNLGLTNITSPTPDMIFSAEYDGEISTEALGASLPPNRGERSIVLDDKTVVKLPKRLRNTDLQVYLRYRF